MNKKLLFFDIDGTLLSETTHTVPDSTIQALKQAKANGHLIFINTGRTRCTIDQIIQDLPIDGYVCGCGTHIIYGNDTLYHHELKEERCQEIAKLFTKYNVDGIFEGRYRIYFPDDIEDDIVQMFFNNYEKQGFPLGKLSDEHMQGDKFCIQFYHDVEDFYKEIDQEFEIIRRSPTFSEIVPLGHSKATGIQFLINHFGLSLDDCYVFGDSFNDESMLTYVQHSIVMKNGDEELFKIAEYVTDTLENDGIEKAMKHYQLI